MVNWKEHYKKGQLSFEGAAKLVKSGDSVVTGLAIGGCSPQLFDAILDRNAELENVRLIDTIQLRPCRLHDPAYMANLEGRITYAPAFGIATTRKMYESGLADFIPINGRDLGERLNANCDIFCVMVTPPNAQGFVSLGLSNFYSMEIIKNPDRPRIIIAEINDQMPVVFGNNWHHVSEFDYFIEHSSPMPTFVRAESSATDKTIAKFVLELINDGDTIQMGIGGIPEAVISGLEGKKDLGVISEMFPMGLPQLVEKGIVTNEKKPLNKGVTVATFCMGDQSMYDYSRENPKCEFHPGSYTNDPRVLSQHPNLVTINMALMVDLSGQINSEGLGHRMVSGSGGQLDFTISAFWSDGGKGIQVINAARQMKDGSLASAILPELPPGTPITVPRTYSQYVISEYGIANLKYKSRRDRAMELISISHPDLRGELKAALRKNFYPAAAK